VKSLFQNCKPFHDFVIKVGNKLKEWGKIVWTKVQPALKVIWEVIKKIVTIYIKAMILEFKVVWNVIKMIWNVLKTVWDILFAIGKWVVGALMAYFKAWWAIIQAVWNVLKTVWDGLVSGGKTAWNWLKSMFNWIKTAALTVWDGLYNAFVAIANKIIGAYNSTLGGLLSAIGIDAKVSLLKTVDHTSKPKKHHSGGIVQGPRGKEVPAILQAGEAVISLAQMNAGRGRGGGNSLNVQPNAVNIIVNGNADAATTAEIKKHVDAQFKELHRTLKGMGR
jgi:phage-related protein